MTTGKSPSVTMRFSCDDVGPRYTSVSLVLVQQRIQGVLITPVDPSTPAGTIPARVGARSSAPGGGNHSRINGRHRQSDTSRECSKRSKSHTATKRTARAKEVARAFFCALIGAAWRILAVPLRFDGATEPRVSRMAVSHKSSKSELIAFKGFGERKRGACPTTSYDVLDLRNPSMRRPLLGTESIVGGRKCQILS